MPPVFPAQRLPSLRSVAPEGEGESGVDDLMGEHLVHTPRAIHAETGRTTDWENVDSAKTNFPSRHTGRASPEDGSGK